MSSAVDATGNPIPTSAVLTASAKHIGLRCMPENVAFLKCKKNDPNPEKCLDKGRDVTRCVLGLLKDLHQKCQKEMDDYVGCMYYYTNEFDLCRKEQEAFEKVCPLKTEVQNIVNLCHTDNCHGRWCLRLKGRQDSNLFLW
ncbi:unnamed protein product [Eruca vesicaria subsp. sativa]|uniref:CHCH domain-containing protein n=1 Tax=Eruca vesicaria subsp. sativa TaxID=29727 RepID=A0ABC8LCU1_ERUVS|nr:unnamed protein product [Eruca vesicaria subsp. sativa]